MPSSVVTANYVSPLGSPTVPQLVYNKLLLHVAMMFNGLLCVVLKLTSLNKGYYKLLKFRAFNRFFFNLYFLPLNY